MKLFVRRDCLSLHCRPITNCEVYYVCASHGPLPPPPGPLLPSFRFLAPPTIC